MLEKKEKRAIISFYHPKGNSLSKKNLMQLAAEINQAAEDETIKVIILKSQGDKAFCGGASFEELRSVKTSDEAKDFFMGFAILLSAIRRCPKFIIARVQGKAVGGGVGLIAACDYALAHQSASIKLAELEIGIGPFVIASAVEKKIGKGAFSFLTIDTQWRDAAWCKLHSLYAEVYPTTEELDSGIEKLAERL
ncbi:MAG: enoyl-CoA hydratase/isomerase family protein, partial [Methanococcaceae archaeon]